MLFGLATLDLMRGPQYPGDYLSRFTIGGHVYVVIHSGFGATVLGLIAPVLTWLVGLAAVWLTPAPLTITLVILAALALVGLWLWMARATSQGKNWARILSTVLFALATLELLSAIDGIGKHGVVDALLAALTWLSGLAAVWMLLRPAATAFFNSAKAMRSRPPSQIPPRAWDDHAIGALGTLVRRLHDATESFQPPADASWQPSFARLLPGNHPVFGHGDTGPWNVVAQGGIPVAFIDWEFAGPVDALWELAEAAWLNAQLDDDDIAERVGLPPAARRSQQVRLLLDAHGLLMPMACLRRNGLASWTG